MVPHDCQATFIMGDFEAIPVAALLPGSCAALWLSRPIIDFMTMKVASQSEAKIPRCQCSCSPAKHLTQSCARGRGAQ